MWRKVWILLGLTLSGGLHAADRVVLPFEWEGLTALRWDASRQQGVIIGNDQYVGFRYREGLLRTLTGAAAPGASDVNLDPLTGDYFVAAQTEGTLKFVSGRDFSLKASVPAAAPAPTRVFLHPILKKLGSFNGPGTLTLFDADNTAYEGLIPLAEVPKVVVLSPDGRVVALLPERKELVFLSYRPFRILMRFPLPAECMTPEDVIVDSLHARYWLACDRAGVFFADYPSLQWQKDESAGPARRLFWDGDRDMLVLWTDQYAIKLQKGGLGAPQLLAQFGEHTVLDWDHRFHRPVTATWRAEPREIELSVHTNLTLE